MEYVILAPILFGSCSACLSFSESKVLEFVHEQQRSGTLKRACDFLYVDIDDRWIHQIAPFIQEEGFSEPPYFGSELVGAHISVAFPSEIEKISEIAECSKEIDFDPKRCEIVYLENPNPFLPNVKELYLLIIEAPQLDRIREKYGLLKQSYPFHITLGVK